MIGLDTGFFVELLLGNPTAVAVWRELVDGTAEGSVSCMSLFEIERLGLRGAISDHRTLLDGIPAVCNVHWIYNPEILSAAAGLSHGLGIPAVDSLILAAFLEAGARTVYTSDPHLETYRKKGVKIVNLRKGGGMG